MAAKNYTEILALVNAGNQMGLSNTIKRDYGIPLDFTSVQPSFDDAVIYAAENTKAYVGQPLSVGGKLYIINDVAAAEKHVVGEKEYDNYLVEVGSATEGDGITIDLEEGVLTLHGFESALTGYLPRKAEDGSLEWVPISAVVQGDGNKVTTLTSEDDSVTITKKTDTDDSLVYDLSVVHPNAPEYAIVADERTEDATSTTYHLTKDGKNVDVAIVVPDAYDDTALDGRVGDLEDKVDTGAQTVSAYVAAQIANAEIGKLTKIIIDEVNLEDNKVVIEGETTDPIEHVIYMLKVAGATGDSYKEYMVIGGALVQTGDTTTDLGNYYTKEEIAGLGYAVASEVKATYATQQSVTDLGTAVDTKLEAYAKTADVNAALDNKANSADVYTKNEIDVKIGVPGTPAVKDDEGNVTEEAVAGTGVYQHVYSKDEVTALIADITGGESAADVKAELAAYKTTNDTRVKTIEDKIGVAGEGQADEGDTLYSLIAEAKAQADKGVADALTAKGIADSAAAQAGQNKTDIARHLTRIEVLETAKGDHETRISTAEGQIVALIAEDKTINKAIGAINGQIIKLQGEDSKLAGLISANTTEIGKKANVADVYTKNEVDTTIEGINEELGKKLVAADLADYAKSADVDNTYAKIASVEAIYKAGEGETAATGLLVDEIARAIAEEQRLNNAIKLLTDGAGTDEIDSVTELIDYVNNHGATVNGINDRLDGHDALLVGIGGEDQPATVLAAIEAAAYTLPIATAEKLGGVISAKDTVDADVTIPAVNAVYVAADTGAMSVKAISTDVLVNGVEEFVLYGGNSGATQA